MANPVKDSEFVVDTKISPLRRVYHLALSQEQLARNVMMVGNPKRALKAARFFDLDTENDVVQNREFISVTGTYKGMPITVIGTGIGTDNVEIVLVECFGLAAFNLRTRTKKRQADSLTIVRVGTSGGPQKGIQPGTLAISDYALGLDNTGLFYQTALPDETAGRIEAAAYQIITEATPAECRFKGWIRPYASKASSVLRDALARVASKRGYPYTTGITASASGFFGPQGREIPGLPITVPMLQERLAELYVDGLTVVNIEMESSLLFHLARSLDYRACTICPIVANRPAGTFLEDYSEEEEHAIKVALIALRDIYREEEE